MLVKYVIIFVLITLCIYGSKAQKQDPNRKKNTYGHGTYGNKAREITRLETKNPGAEISGKTHQFEHPVPMRQLLRDTNLVRGKGEGGKIERNARAYSEVKERHADHIGTGNFVKQSQQGFYLKDMVNAEGNGEDSKVIMIQLNQLGYVNDKNNWVGKGDKNEEKTAKQFQETSKTEKGQISSNSFNFMIATDPDLSETAKLESVLTRMLMDEGKLSYTNDDVFKAQETLKMITKEIEDDKAEKNKQKGMKMRKKNQKKRQKKEKQKKKEEKDEKEEKEEDKKEKEKQKEESNKENDENSKNEEKNEENEEKPANNENESKRTKLNNDDKEKNDDKSQKSSGA